MKINWENDVIKVEMKLDEMLNIVRTYNDIADHLENEKSSSKNGQWIDQMFFTKTQLKDFWKIKEELENWWLS